MTRVKKNEFQLEDLVWKTILSVDSKTWNLDTSESGKQYVGSNDQTISIKKKYLKYFKFIIHSIKIK